MSSANTIQQWRFMARRDVRLNREIRQLVDGLCDALDRTLLPPDVTARITAGILLHDLADQLPEGLAGRLKAVRDWQ